MCCRLSAAAVCGAVISLLAIAGRSQAQNTQYFTPIPTNGVGITLQQVVTGLTSPIDFQSTPDGHNIVTDQTGKVQIVQGGAVQSTVIDVSSLLTPLTAGYDERGLMGFAYDPQFNNSASTGFHKVYTLTDEPVNGAADFTTTGTIDHQDVVSQWTVSSANLNLVDTSVARKILLKIDHPSFNHDGGMKFGPDGDLYIATGDGGGANDSGNGHTATANPQYPSQNLGNAQDATKALGKMLRIDVHGNNSANGQYGIPADNPFVNAPNIGTSPVVKEIYAYGLRNMYHFSFDSANGNLIGADVGQNNVEEVDKITKGGNFGWHIKEGTLKFNSDGTVSTDLTGVPTSVTDPNGNTTPLIDPLAEYDHTQGIAIIGGFVYHGSLQYLQGKYIFGDFSMSFGTPSGKLFYADLSTGQITEFSGGLNLLPGQFVKGMGEDASGEVYVTTSTVLGPTGTTGSVFLIVPEPATIGLVAAGMLMLGRPRRRRA